MGVAEVFTNSSDHDRFVVTVNNFSTLSYTAPPSSNSVWLVDLTKPDAKAQKITDIPEACVLNGLVHLNSVGEVLIAESTGECIWKLNVLSKRYSCYLCDEIMKPLPDPTLQVGLNGIKCVWNPEEHYFDIYYTNTVKRTLHSVHVDEQTGKILSHIKQN
jgi:hypothetical protein